MAANRITAPELQAIYAENPVLASLLRRIVDATSSLQSQVTTLSAGTAVSTISATIGGLLSWTVPGTLSVDNAPGGSAAPVILMNALTVNAFQAKIITGPVGADVVIAIGRTPAGGARAVVATLTIPAGTNVSSASGSVAFDALDTVDIQILTVGAAGTEGGGLAVGQVIS